MVARRIRIGSAASGVTLNPSDKHADITLSGGNLVATATTTAFRAVRATVSALTGKLYYEMTLTNNASPGSGIMVGIANGTSSLSQYIGQNLDSIGYANDGAIYLNAGNPSFPGSYTTGAIIGVETDLDAETIRWFVVGGITSAVTDYSSLNAGPYFPAINLAANGDVVTMNFGASAWARTPNTGYVAWA
jgi:hypothetical protein